MLINWIQIIVLAIIQGLTEFLPVSSSAHLILIPQITGWADQGMSFDISVHFGTLMAVVYYFRHDLKIMFADTLKAITGQGFTPFSHLSLQIILATIPVCIVGVLFHDWIQDYARSPMVIAFTTLVFGFFLWFSARFSNPLNNEINYKNSFIIGLAQVLALIPGVSRSGITLSAALCLGLNRITAARFAFLLAIPVIFSAMSYETLKLMSSNTPQPWLGLGVAALLSAIFAFGCIHWFLKLIEKIGVVPFVIYRLCLGVFLLIMFNPMLA